LLKELKDYASEIGIDYYEDKQLPRNAVWLTRKLNMVKSDLRHAGITIEPIKSNERTIWIKKGDKTNNEQQEKIRNMEGL
jgi:D-mannonate dehydratase